MLIRQLAHTFWARAGEVEPFPRSLESPALRGLPVGIVKLPRLGLTKARTWLLRRGVECDLKHTDRPLRGLLVARAGEGLIFLDGNDSADDQRISLAHEIAHFLTDHLVPRERALRTFGDRILPVLNGERPPTAEEQLTGALTGMRLGLSCHLLDRNARGYACQSDVVQSEDLADRLGLELLAPEADVAAAFESAGGRWRSQKVEDMMTAILSERFGLSSAVATSYGAYIVLRRRSPTTFQEWLRGK